VFFDYMIEKDHQQSIQDKLAICLLDELQKTGSCNLEMLGQVLASFNDGNPYKIALERAVQKSNLPENLKLSAVNCDKIK